MMGRTGPSSLETGVSGRLGAGGVENDGKDRPQLPGDWGFREAGGRWGGEGENVVEGEEA